MMVGINNMGNTDELKKLYLDFDGTVVEFAYPKIGKLVPNALRVIKRLQDKNIYTILNTQRVEIKNNSFKEAKEFLVKNGVKIDEYTTKKIHPKWKIPIGNIIYIDDIADGIPLLFDSGNQMMVDWLEVEKILEKYNIL